MKKMTFWAKNVLFVCSVVFCFAVFLDEFANHGRGLDKLLRENDKRQQKELMHDIDKMYGDLNKNLVNSFSKR